MADHHAECKSDGLDWFCARQCPQHPTYMTFYEAVTTSVKLDPQSPDDEYFGCGTWFEMTGPIQMVLQTDLTPVEASQAVEREALALPSDRYLFVTYFHVKDGIRVGFFRSPKADILEWGETKHPSWFYWTGNTPSRYQLLMEDE